MVFINGGVGLRTIKTGETDESFQSILMFSRGYDKLVLVPIVIKFDQLARETPFAGYCFQPNLIINPLFFEEHFWYKGAERRVLRVFVTHHSFRHQS